jgi:rSAM/selenodomain-associated transferase 2
VTVSVITPALNEAHNLAERARELSRQEAPWEWIVVDGGSEDGTPQRARDLGATVLSAPRGRGPQLNVGAGLAKGDILLFLHADTTLPDGAFVAIRDACRETRIVGGNFAFRFADDSIGGRFLGFVYASKQRMLRAWYGDSAMFVRREVFSTLGGFENFPIMEDLDFAVRLRRFGATVRLPLTVTSSPRRYRGRLVATIVRWTVIFGLYKLGVSPHRLARFYPPHRERPGSGLGR